MSWYEIKEWLEMSLGLNMDALHVHAGVLVQILAALLMRRSLRSPWPWLVVCVAIIGNEIYDLHHETWPDADRPRQLAEGFKDMWNTMFLPTLLLVATRWRPQLFAGRDDAAKNRAKGHALAP